MANEVSTWLKNIPFKLRRELAGDIQRIAGQLADDIRNAAPKGETGNLAESVRVRRGRHTLELFVEAGGQRTTKEVRSGSGVLYDYALGVEFGTSKMRPHPFFWTTYRARRDAVNQEITAAVERALAQL